jgi:hypothetical protein
MKAVLPALALLGVVAIGADSASAGSPAYCDQYAQNQVYKYSHPVGSAAIGCGVGALAMNLLSHGNGAATAGGCAVGGVTGFAMSDAKRREIYDQAYNQCLYSGAPPAYVAPVHPQPVYAQPPVVVLPPIGSPPWNYQCSQKYKSFVATGPGTPGYFTGFDYQQHPCSLP